MKSSEFLKQAKALALDPIELEQMLLHVLQISYDRRHSLLSENPTLTHSQIIKLQNIIRQRHQHVPLAYILGECFFYNLELNINRHCLIPRPDTELLVEATLTQLQPIQNTKPHYLDMACGSGAVALAVIKELPHIQAFGSDICPNALQVAQSNAQRHNLPIQLVLSDWAKAFASVRFDCISANPPYIAHEELHLMNPETGYEPSLALFAAENGLLEYKRITLDAKRILKPGGWLIMEHGYRQAEQVRALLSTAGFTAIATLDDISNHPRVTKGQIA